MRRLKRWSVAGCAWLGLACQNGAIGDSAASIDEGDHATCTQFPLVDGPVSFAGPIDVSSGVVASTALDAGDLNGDGYPDVVFFRSNGSGWMEGPKSPGGAWVKHGLPQPPTIRPFLGAARVGDIDGDGDDDLAVSMDGQNPSTAYFYWYENPGPSNVATASAWQVHQVAGGLALEHINDMALGDMDGDGKLDIVARSLVPNRLHIFFQDSKTAWSSRFLDAAPFGPEGEGFALGDVDRQGQLDITVCGYWLEAPANPRTGTYAQHTIDSGYSTVNANVKEQVGDINGDGRNDVVISPAEGYRNGGNHVLAWYEAPADPRSATSWTQHIIESNTNGGHTVRLGDMDSDGDLDVVHGIAWNMWGQSASIRIFFNTGGGTFSTPQTVYSGAGLYTGVLFDAHLDGDLDIAGQESYGGVAKNYFYESQESDGVTPTCSDGKKNGAETGVDCGGPCKACPRCGDGAVQAPEACDDGNQNDTDTCSNTCVIATCVDGTQNQGETGLDCGGPCEACMTAPVCGNGIKEAPEACDDGNSNDADTCSNRCVRASCQDGEQNQGEHGLDCGGPCAACAGSPVCGNGTVEAGEQCDDGNSEDSDDCLATCVLATCGDGILNQDEEDLDCGGSCPACDVDTTTAVCGDGKVEGREECDDGNTDDSDDCAGCQLARCTDGILQEGETCDDGNQDNGDRCLNDCTVATCGDGVVLIGSEACDDGNRVDDDHCSNTCELATCDDGIRNKGELGVDCDGPCQPCASPSECGNGTREVGEVCDDGNEDESDACTSQCRPPSCSDGMLNGTEDGVDCGGACGTLCLMPCSD